MRFDDDVPAVRPTPARPVVVVAPTTPLPSRITERRSVTECARFVRDYSSLTYHILGGEATSLGDFPHMAAIGYTSFDTPGEIGWNCGGSLVAENYVMTAAHCLTRSQPTVVRLGQVNLNTNTVEEEQQDIAISEILLHPDYQANRNYHDIALLRLATNTTFIPPVYERQWLTCPMNRKY